LIGRICGVCLPQAFLGRQLGVAHKAVQPGVDDFDLQFVSLLLHDAGNIDAPRGGPNDAEIAACVVELKGELEKIREQAELLDIANDAIYVTAIDGTILYWNQGAERLLGWTSAEAIGRTSTGLFSRDPKIGDNQTAILLQEGNWAGEERQRTKGGREVVVFSRLTLVRGEARQPRAVFVISSDITEKKEIEAQFLRAQRVESLGALAGGMAHDLNNVLTPILMAMPLLREEKLSAEVRALIETLDESVHRGADMADGNADRSGGFGSHHHQRPVWPEVFAFAGTVLAADKARGVGVELKQIFQHVMNTARRLGC